VEFEYDPNKSAANFRKHGIDFEDAQTLWRDIHLAETSSKDLNEPRYLHIGKIENEYWTAVTTLRSSKLRLISVRRSRKNEIELYES